MSLSVELPPVIARQRAKERDLYVSASARPERRVEILCDYAKCMPLADEDLLALAIEEVRCAYQSRLPPGEYRNARGHAFVVSDDGRRSTVSMRGPPPQGLVWVPRYLRPTPWQLPSGYHFVLGAWYPAPPTPPGPIAALDFFGAAQHHQYQAPPGFEGATYREVLPPITQQLQSGGLLLQQQQSPIPVPAAYDGHRANFAAAPTQQPYVAATPLQQPFTVPTAVEQQPFPLPTASEQQPQSPPAATSSLAEETFEDFLRSILLQENARMASDESHEAATQTSRSDCPYAGYAPADSI